MRRILIPVSFSKSSKNSLRYARLLSKKAKLSLLHVYPLEKYNRKYDFGKKKYEEGIKDKLKKFSQDNEEMTSNTIFLAQSGAASEAVKKISKGYDVMVMSRKNHTSKKGSYFSDKKLFIATNAQCPVLIMPMSDMPFSFKKCEHVWHIKRRRKEPIVVAKGMEKLGIRPERMEVKTLQQKNFLSSFWENIIAYKHSHKKKLLKKIDKAHDAEPIDLIILVENDPSLFTKFFKSDILHLFCHYDIPILFFPAY